MREVPVMALPSKPSFMVIDGKSFLVEPLTESPEQLMRSTEEYYAVNLAELKEKVLRHISEESQDDLNKQVLRIERHLNSDVVTLPEGLQEHGSLMFLADKKVYATRVVLFKPSRISCTLQMCGGFIRWIDTNLSRRDAERFTKFCDWARPILTHHREVSQDTSGVKVDIIVNQDLVIEPLVVSYVDEENLIYCYPKQKHPHAHGGGMMCTGQTNARVFWEDPNFVENFNSLNPHSWAASSTRAATEYKMFLKNQYFVEARIRTQEVSAWRV